MLFTTALLKSKKRNLSMFKSEVLAKFLHIFNMCLLKMDRSCVCVLHFLFVFCVVHYFRRSRKSEKCHMEIINLLSLKAIVAIPSHLTSCCA